MKSLVLRARSALIARREARLMPCEEIREQLANLRGGALRRTDLRLHLEGCPGCRTYRDEVKRQRAAGSRAPTAPGSGLELSVLAAAGVGAGGAAAGGAAAGGVAAAGAGAALSGAGSMLLSKLALAGLLAGGGVAAEPSWSTTPAGAPCPRRPRRTSEPATEKATR